MEDLVELRIFVRDRLTNTIVRQFSQEEWIDYHDARVAASLEMWLKTVGGTISMTGTPEFGRITVYNRPWDKQAIMDIEWYVEVFNG